MTRIIAPISALLIVVALALVVILPASAVETEGSLIVCADGFTGQLRLVDDAMDCERGETAYEIEGEQWFAPDPENRFTATPTVEQEPTATVTVPPRQ